MKAFPKGTSQAAVKKAIAKMPSVYQHKAGDYILKNPRGKPVGRDFKFYTLELHPKTQLDETRSDHLVWTGRCSTRPGTQRQRRFSKHLDKDSTKVLDADIEARNAKHRKDKKTRKDKFPKMGLMITGGKHKKTGNFAPYRIKLPKSHFAIGRTRRCSKHRPAIWQSLSCYQSSMGEVHQRIRCVCAKGHKVYSVQIHSFKEAEHRGLIMISCVGKPG